MSLPTILIVPGAWHTPDAFDPTAQLLQQAGYETVSVSLASVGSSDPPTDFGPDANAIRAKLEPLVDAGKSVVVVAHSYGSLPASEAVKGLDSKSRSAAGKKGGVVHFFYLSAFVLPEGATLLGGLGGKDAPWWDVSEDKRIVNPIKPAEIFYNDFTEAQIQTAVPKLKTFSYQLYNAATTYSAWRDVPSTYLYCTRDQAIPIAAQKGMVEGTAAGAGIRTEEVDASHSPFISKPEETAAAIRRAAGEKV